MLQSITNRLAFFESVFGRGDLAANGKNFAVRCPICAPTDASKRKLAIKVDDDLNHCWTCGWRAYTLAPLIRKYGTQEQLSRYRDEFMPEAARHRRERETEGVEQKKKLQLPDDFRLLTLAASNDPDAKAAWNYLERRGVTWRDAWYFKLGISNDFRWKRRVIVPSFDADGALNYYTARSFEANDRRPKYENPDEDKLTIIFNEINIDWTKRLVLCEGPFDLMKCCDNAVPLLGSDLNEQSNLFTQILLHGTPVALALDGDMWYKKTPKIAKKLQDYDIDVLVVDTRDHLDPGQMTKKQFQDALDAAKLPTWRETFFDRLEKMSEMKLKMRDERPRSTTSHAARR